MAGQDDNDKKDDAAPEAGKPQDADAPSAHSIQDHTMGFMFHEHEGDEDHDHDEFQYDGPLEENPLWIQDNVHLTSVGIDIGSSGTQVIFSRIHLRRLAEDMTSRYYVVSRDQLYLSPVALTPYASETRIDDEKLKAIIAQAYVDGGIDRADVDTGAVILTGEALRRENAQAISALLNKAAISSARPPAITWKACSPPMDQALRRLRLILASAFST
jgi:ethanolamine utilization protein EutA